MIGSVLVYALSTKGVCESQQSMVSGSIDLPTVEFFNGNPDSTGAEFLGLQASAARESLVNMLPPPEKSSVNIALLIGDRSIQKILYQMEKSK